jgi:hypothetical protein
MKRRNFLTALFGVGALAVAAPLAYVATHKKEAATYSAKYLAKRKARALFQRFFKTATTFEANLTQMFWFDQYQSGEIHNFVGARRTGMTTFMLVLALFENKCHGTNIAWFPSNSHMHRRCNEMMSVMQDRLGKSIKDGTMYSNYGEFRDLLGSSNPLKVFVMNDADRLPTSFECTPYLCGQSYFFGTTEPRGYKASELIPAKYFYAPFIPLHYA